MTTGERIKARRKELGINAETLAERCGVSPATIYRYENGDIEKVGLDKLPPIAAALHTTQAYLLGWDDTAEVEPSPLPANVVPLQPMKKIPLVGQIACGVPILAEQNIEDYIDLPGHIHADYALTCKGDSMINAGIRDGDVVYIRQQPEVENGQIAAVMVDEDEATLKRFYFDDSIVQLVAENPAVRPMVFTGADISRVRVLGLAVGYTHIIN